MRARCTDPPVCSPFEERPIFLHDRFVFDRLTGVFATIRSSDRHLPRGHKAIVGENSSVVVLGFSILARTPSRPKAHH
jgi:hypothetical protein